VAYRPHGKARVDPDSPRAFAVCNRCGFLFNAYKLSWQFQWIGNKLQNKRVQVCEECADKTSVFLRQIILPPDPPATRQPREEPYAIDEQGGVAVPLFFTSAGVLVSVTPPSWATGFFAGCYGGGAAGSIFNGSYPNMGGGGCAYAWTNVVSLTGGATVWVYVGLGGTSGGYGEDSWASTTGVAPLIKTEGCLAKGGAPAFPPPLYDPTAGIGGQASACIGDGAYSGGNGGLAAAGPSNVGGTGGGGAAGPNGAGLNAADTVGALDGTAGGQANGTHGVGTGGQPGRGTLDVTVNIADGAGLVGGFDPVYAMSGGPGGGGGGGGGGASATRGGMGGAGGLFGGGGGGGGYAAGTNGKGGAGGHGGVVLRWLQ